MDIKKKEKLLQGLEKDLGCYVLITCTPAALDGTLHAEMNYKGDPYLASYLLQQAQTQIDFSDLDS